MKTRFIVTVEEDEEEVNKEFPTWDLYVAETTKALSSILTDCNVPFINIKVEVLEDEGI